MKLLVVLVFTTLLSYSTYSFFTFRKNKRLARITSISIAAFILGFVTLAIIRSSRNDSDGWCNRNHRTTSYPPSELVTAMDYFEEGNYYYDIGECNRAVESYTKSIELNSSYPQSFNNRGYTYMRLRDFEKALPDLTNAIELNPNYYNALKNRADTYSKFRDYQKASIDYERAIVLGGSNDLCGDLFTARYEGTGFWNQLFSFPKFMLECSKKVDK